jgi:sigma-B regulation protein RsbU (phosphoserine phosphatase)
MQKNSDAEILVVDDDRLTRKLLVRTLSSEGYTCAESESGTDAWERVHARQPALVLLDLDMPGLNGAELLKRLRSDQDPDIAQIPAIMLTGHGGEESEVLCLEAGADDFVTKPINMAVLQARIGTQLRLRLMRRQLEGQKEELEAWRHNLERDLAAARLTQQSLIPQKPLKIPGWDIAACFRPVIQVGGDIYGWLAMKDSRILFWMADATGHGASAALLTTLTKLLFHHGSLEHTTPAAIMEAVNDDFRSIFGARLLMTAMCVALEPATGSARVVGAGHPPLMISRANGKRALVWSSAPPLGLAERKQFVETIVDLRRGDAFLLYTDGLFGSSKSKRTRLNPKKLARMLDHTARNADSFLSRVVKQAAPVDGDGTLSDDIAALVVRRMV